MIKVVEKKKIWFSISLTVILVGLVLLFTRGLNFGIDFKGGTKLQVELGEKLDTAALDEIINKYDSSASCKIVNDTQYEIKSTVLDETTSSELLNEIEETFADLKNAGVDILTVGQYIQPSKQHLEIDKYYSLKEFEEIKDLAKKIGFKKYQIGPLVRSSYHAKLIMVEEEK